MVKKRKEQSNKKIQSKARMATRVILLFILFLCVIFFLLPIKENKIVKGVKIGEIDVSNLTQEEAKEKVEQWYKRIGLSDIVVVYQDVEETITVEQFNGFIDSNQLVKEAYLVGKSGNIIKDKYQMLCSMILKKKIEINIKLNEEKLDKKMEEMNAKLPNALKESNYYIEGDNLIIKKGKSGILIEKEKFKEELKEAIEKEENRKFMIPTKQVSPKEINIEKIYEEIYRESKNAVVTKDPIQVHPHVIGIDFAITKEEVKQMLEQKKEEYDIPLIITMPEITLEKLGKEAFPNLLATFSTRYNIENKNRVTNLELVSKKINGTILLPDETFSYNKTVGERSIEKGYKEAAVYSDGKVVNGIGGGICQISSNLYNTAVYANLEIITRSNHRFIPSYITAGRDATVAWGTIDFCFKNTRTYPIKIMCSVKNGIVTTEIYGTKEEKEYEIMVENTITEIIPYTVNKIKDHNLPQGSQVIKQYGANGVKSVTYKIVIYNGEVISKTILSKDSYSPLEGIIKIGTKN